ncbi:chromosome partitioning protein [Micromonospora sp. NBC_01412]|uniref:chromosome partitioning protein n=1 Tax=Micromonospora sp. NBC_01412 TaxID=2903590 RepID=UPI003864F3C4
MDGPDGWAPVPSETAWAPPSVGGVPAPRVGQPAPGSVDLHLPFTLDQAATAHPAPIPARRPVDSAGPPDPSTPPAPVPPTPVPPTPGPPTVGPPTVGPPTVGPPTVGPAAPEVTGPTAVTDPTASGGQGVSGAAGSDGGRNGTAGGSVPGSNGGVRGTAESPWALPPRRPGTSGPEQEGPGPDGAAADGAAADGWPGGLPGGTEPGGTEPHASLSTAPGPAGTAVHPPGPFPPVMNPPGPLPPTPYPPATGGTPADSYVAGPPAADPYAAGGPAAVTGPPMGWGPGQQPGPGSLAAGQPSWYPPGWPQHGQQPAAPATHPPYQEADGVTRVPPGYPDVVWTPDLGTAPTAEDFARRRQVRPADPVATMGVRAVVNKTGLIKLPPGRHEQELRHDIEMVRRNFGGLRQVTVVNPKGGAGKTVAILLLAMTFGQKRGGYVLAWDNNETQGTLGMRAQQDFHSRTVRDMLRDLGQFQGAHGRVGDLSQYVRSQGEGMFDVLASDESATGGEMLTASAFAEIREVVSRFYKLIFVDTGNNVRAQNWQAAMDATDQLVVTMSARNDSAETAARMLDHLEQSGRQRLVRQAVTVVSMPPSRKEIDLPAIQEHFAARTRAVLLAPYERLIDTGEPIRYGGLSSATRDAWLKIAASVAEGL